MVNKDEKERKLNQRIALIGSIVSILLVAAVGFAYFSATAVNTNNERLSTETATLSLKFDDGDNGISGNLNLGESITKKFTLQNTGTLDAYAKINWYNLVNTYMQGSLTYNLEQSTSENGTYTSIDNSNVPVSSTETTETLKNGILVPVNTTYYYKLTITFNNLENVNQNSDINARFYSYFSLEEGSLSGADKIQNLVVGANPSSVDVINAENVSDACTNTLAYDGTVDNNLRYVGSNPCNYVTFNGESAEETTVYRIVSKSDNSIISWGEAFDNIDICNSRRMSVFDWDTNSEYYECKVSNEILGGWRIIGIMNNVDDGTGKKETRIKLIRGKALGNYSWDTSESSVNSGNGVNDWTGADLMQELNGDYLNTNLNTNMMWYNGKNNQKTGVYDYTKGLKAKAQNLIENAKWYFGTMSYSVQDNYIPSALYTWERGNIPAGVSYPYGECNDGYCPRNLEWSGKVALPYPSDYGFATSGGSTTNRNNCIEKMSLWGNYPGRGWTWSNSEYSDCPDNDWISTQYTLTPHDRSYSSSYYIDSNSKYVMNTDSFSDYAVHPVVYLKSNVTITGGNGSPENPFIFE